jgi:hypothetical protein
MDSLNILPYSACQNWQKLFPEHVILAVEARSKVGRLGLRAFFDWLASCPKESSGSVVREAILSGKAISSAGSHSYERLFADAVQSFAKEYMAQPDGPAMHARSQYVSYAKAELEKLAGRGFGGIPPRFRSEWVPTSVLRGPGAPSLGEAEWPELDGLDGIAREREALRLVRHEFEARFALCDRLFDFGQDLLRNSEPPTGTDPEARSLIRAVLLAHRAALESEGAATIRNASKWTFRLSGDKLHAVKGHRLRRFRRAHDIKDREIWLRAGGIDPGLLGESRKYHYLAAILGCLGPTKHAVWSGMGLLICDTGWNYQPARDLPRDPVLFRSASTAFVGGSAFIESFKKRAGHHVLAWLAENQEASGGRLEAAMGVWNEAVRADDPQGFQDGYAGLQSGARHGSYSTLDVLDRFRTMADAARTTIGSHASREVLENFWVSLTPRGGQFGALKNYVERGLEICFPGSIVARPGFNFQAVRKSVLLLRRDEAGTIGAVRVAAGHTGTSVLMPHYLNTPSVNTELDASIREFQDVLEAVLVQKFERKDLSALLGKSKEKLERLRALANRSGVASTLGLIKGAESEDGSLKITFSPTDEKLFELYMIHRKLRRLLAEHPNRGRARMDFVPMLAYVKALGRECFRKGLGPQYKAAARLAAQQLRDGTMVLPVLED